MRIQNTVFQIGAASLHFIVLHLCHGTLFLVKNKKYKFLTRGAVLFLLLFFLKSIFFNFISAKIQVQLSILPPQRARLYGVRRMRK